jgi:hypothetical protein
MGRLADGVIVGSAIVRHIEERATSPTLVTDVGDFIATLKSPLRDLAAASSAGSARATPSGGRQALAGRHARSAVGRGAKPPSEEK